MSEDDSKDHGKKMEDFIQETIGDFGKWQLRISLLMALLKFPIPWIHMGIVFLAPPTQFWCKPPEAYANLSTADWLQMNDNGNIPLERAGLNTGYCSRIDFEGNANASVDCGGSYEYNTTIFHSTIISEWDLVCENKRMVDISQISLMLGVLTGNIIFGTLADRLGRKRILIFCIFIQAIFGLISAFVPWFWLFLLVRLLMAVANGGTTVTSFVMCMEVVGGKWRSIVPILYQIPYGFGNSIMAGLAYFFRDWRQFQLATFVLSSLYISYLWLIPESPRWLYATGQKEEAVKILENAAKTNKLDVDKVRIAAGDINNNSNDSRRKVSASTLFTTRELKKRTLLLCLNWFISGTTFYAFSQYVGKVGSNLFFTASISGFVAFPGTIFCIFIVARYGRRLTIASASFLTAICFFGILAIPIGAYQHDWPRVMFGGIGIIGLSISIPALYLFTGELYPTTVRNVGIGVSVMSSRLGSILAPLIISMQEKHPALPLIILAVTAVIETLIILPLPETKGTALLETIQDLELNDIDGNKEKDGYVSVSTAAPTEAA